ncbi:MULTISPECIES: serine hydrolase domain-containing protein [Shewanella]|uniref:Serine hydrolase n=1 Tax=Shewanella fidelis TaxID=173509 RepID=A0AAW8NHE5_9GAMM|nr:MULTISPECIES: serine hydrolase domain-containing protein [Shewanella]MDR8522773.1 serine hydrolase [Shewanella fidelis]MDW4812388.1 serine hydrolase [Shewanella fidelis]MDW4815947.1 serine hydrolase [Shewanella fidelis]MDW4820629.1 serine hydrolase [Shewanella fidelis]MDW4824851.1 serine hydrolase [Shewanella fidelis]
MHFITKTLIGSVIAGCCLWAANKASANRAINNNIAQQLPTIITQSQRPFNGVIMVKQDNQAVFTYISGDNISSRTSFLIGSLSKQITASLILKAVDEGLIDLNNSVSHYLLKDGNKPRAYVPPSVTVSQLLSHTSGLVNLGEPPQFKPGSQFQYSNYGYALLGDILQVVYQQPIEQLVNQLAEQYELNGLYAQTGDINNIKSAHADFINGNRETFTTDAKGRSASQLTPVELNIDQPMIAFGGMAASADAYSRFQDTLYNGKLLSSNSLALMTAPQATREHRWGVLEYGYGTQISRDEQLIEYSHSGYIPGYVSLAVYYPQAKVSLVILENTSWDLNNIQRTFGLHDDIRHSLRSRLIALENRPVAKLYQAGVNAVENAMTANNTALKAAQ